MRWDKSQLKKSWAKLSESQKKRYGDFVNYCSTSIIVKAEIMSVEDYYNEVKRK